MAQESSVHLGSGTLPTLGRNPNLSGVLTQDRYPRGNVNEHLNYRGGTNAVILNPEDFSVHFGINAQAVAVGTSPVPLPASPLTSRRALVVHNNGSNTVYLGPSGVSTSQGLPLVANEKIAFDIQGVNNVWIYAVSSVSDVDVRILELS